MRKQPTLTTVAALALGLAACQAPAVTTTTTVTTATSAPAASSGTTTAATAAPASAADSSSATATAKPSSTTAPTTVTATPTPTPDPLVEECLTGTQFCFTHAASVTVDDRKAAGDTGTQLELARLHLIRKGVEIVDVLAHDMGGATACAPGGGTENTSRIVSSTAVDVTGLTADARNGTWGTQAYVVQAVEGNPGYGFRPVTVLTAQRGADKIGTTGYCDVQNLRAGVWMGGVNVTMMTPPDEPSWDTMEQAEAKLAEGPHQAAKEIMLTAHARKG